MRKWIIGAMLLLLAAGIYWRTQLKAPALAEAYIGEPSVTVWSSTAEVHQRVGQLHWGDSVEVLARKASQVQVRTLEHSVGWVEGNALLDTTAWLREKRLLARTRGTALQATGHTKVFSNLRLDPGRDAVRVYQLTGSSPVAIVGRAVSEVPPTAGSLNGDRKAREDWLLVYTLAVSSTELASLAPSAAAISPAPSARASEADLVTGSTASVASAGAHAMPAVAGWVLARFIQLDVPDVIRDYASSSNVHPVAWFVLNFVRDASGAKPQYLLAGTRGGEGGACDFSMLRAYTWDVRRGRYETAFVENGLCGFFPIEVDKQTGTGDPQFYFEAMSGNGQKHALIYRMRQTVIRRVREVEPPTAHPKHRR